MFIRSEHIYLRALESTDLELLYVSENDSSIWKVSNTLTPFSKDVLELYLHSAHQDIYTNKQLRLMICLTTTHESIGTIDLFEFDPMHARVGVGILIFEPYRKKGYASEAIELVKQYTHRTLLMHQLYCNISASNVESLSLFEKCGFEKIGIKKQWNKISRDQFEDEWMYQLIFKS
ncbi:MAG: GNAT family N-acetyltransferase [Bacteroidetes bacterium]|nr:GNAT family N-acetyltransferase [Bacteroidota bacterium]